MSGSLYHGYCLNSYLCGASRLITSAFSNYSSLFHRSEISPSSFIPRHEIFIQSDLPGKGTHTTRLCVLTPNTFKIQQGFFLTKSQDDKSACLSVKPISDQRTLTPVEYASKREETNPLHYIDHQTYAQSYFDPFKPAIPVD